MSTANWKKVLIDFGLTESEKKRLDQLQIHLNSAGFDDWGLDPDTLKAALAACRWIYTDYFRVETVGLENIPKGRVLMISNHGGQLPVDGLLIGMSMLLESEPARLVRGMMERWIPSLPFVSTFFTRCGQMVGDSRNCRELLDRDEAVLVFPEGVRGSGKTFFHRYQLQRFGTGFVRLALESKAPIVPVAVIGCEEAYPSVFNFKALAKLIRAPYIPVTPLFPFLGPIGALPLPTKVTIRYGSPLLFEGDPDAPEAEVEAMVDQVKAAIQMEIDQGLAKRGDHIFTGAAT